MSEKTVFFFGTGAIAIVSGAAGAAAATEGEVAEGEEEEVAEGEEEEVAGEEGEEAADAAFVLVVEAAASWRTYALSSCAKTRRMGCIGAHSFGSSGSAGSCPS